MSIWRKLLGKQTAPTPDALKPVSSPERAVAQDSASPPQKTARLLTSHVLYAERPDIDVGRLQPALTLHLPAARIVSTSDKVIMIAHEDLLLATKDVKPGMPALTNLTLPSNAELTVPNLEHMLQQTWDWPQARETVARATSAVFVNEFMCPHLTLRDRLRVFHGVHRALIDATHPLAICSRSAERVINPAALNKPLPENLDSGILPLFVNVRVFNIANRGPDEHLIDTRGLAELELPDIQMHVKGPGIDVNRLAGKVSSIAWYLLQNGDCIANGHTVEGLEPSQKWTCRHEDALISPARVVLDINPGPPHAAGNRN